MALSLLVTVVLSTDVGIGVDFEIVFLRNFVSRQNFIKGHFCLNVRQGIVRRSLQAPWALCTRYGGEC
jgi:hypothetical protein